MSDDRDWRWLHRPQPAAPALVEHTLWIVEKDGRRAELRVRQHPLGLELRMAVGDRFLWSEVYRPGQGRELGAVADEHRQSWLDRGWQAVQHEAPSQGPEGDSGPRSPMEHTLAHFG